ncbi:MAG: helix-turn-helix domain-containing protein [Rhodospirillales bacterium]|nr:helix-turn-helix domain-containing protein [Rhodospirillales bacterium]
MIKALNRVLNRAYLLDAVSQDGNSPTDRLIDVLVSQIRKKIKSKSRRPEVITTVLGCGHKLRASLK